jgi:ethanolamine utilization protein EutQ
MRKHVVSAADIQRLGDAGERRLDVTPSDVVTPLARDEAARLGIELVQPGNGDAAMPHGNGRAGNGAREPVKGDGADLEAMVRRIVAGVVGGEATAGARPRPVVRAPTYDLPLEEFPFDIDRPQMDVRLVDVVTAEHGSPMAAGVMSLRTGSFPWTLNYDEVEYVIEGELHIGTGDQTVVGKPGDVLYIPKGTSITFGTPSWAKFLYVTYPADWAGG